MQIRVSQNALASLGVDGNKQNHMKKKTLRRTLGKVRYEEENEKTKGNNRKNAPRTSYFANISHISHIFRKYPMMRTDAFVICLVVARRGVECVQPHIRHFGMVLKVVLREGEPRFS